MILSKALVIQITKQYIHKTLQNTIKRQNLNIQSMKIFRKDSIKYTGNNHLFIPTNNIVSDDFLKGPTLAELMEHFIRFPREDYTMNFCRNQDLIHSRKSNYRGVQQVKYREKKINSEMNKNKSQNKLKPIANTINAKYVFKTDLGKKLMAESKKEKFSEKQNEDRNRPNNLESFNSEEGYIPLFSKQKIEENSEKKIDRCFKKIVQMKNMHRFEKGSALILNKQHIQKQIKSSQLLSQQKDYWQQEIKKTSDGLDRKIVGVADKISQARAEIADYLKQYQTKKQIQPFIKTKKQLSPNHKIIFEGVSEVNSQKYDSKSYFQHENLQSNNPKCSEFRSKNSKVLQENDMSFSDHKNIKIIDEQKNEQSIINQKNMPQVIKITQSNNFTFDFDVNIQQSNKFQFLKNPRDITRI